MAKQRNYEQSSLTRKYLNLVEDYLELQRLRVAVKRAEFQELTRKESFVRREETDQDGVGWFCIVSRGLQDGEVSLPHHVCACSRA